jgi:hypothetical protein
VKCPRCELKTNSKHWTPEACIAALKRDRAKAKMAVTFDKGPEKNLSHAYLSIEEYTISQWCPTDDPADSKPEQLHMAITVKAIPYPLVMRFKSRRALELMTGTLNQHADEIWPQN